MYHYTFLVVVLAICASHNSVFAQQHREYSERSVSSGFDVNIAYSQLYYAYSSYCPEDQIQGWDCFFCQYNNSVGATTQQFVFSGEYEDALYSTFAYVGKIGNSVVVAFRGSVDIENWISNLDVAHATPYSNVPSAFVHEGFLDTYNSVRSAVRASVLSIVRSSGATQVYITGHSLGAAVATLCALDLSDDLRALNVKLTMYNFGSPRVGNQAFVDYFRSKVSNVYRVVNQRDVVAHLPSMSMGFRHVAQEIWVNTPTTYIVCDQTGEDSSCSDSLWIYNIQDHLNYFSISLEQGGC